MLSKALYDCSLNIWKAVGIKMNDNKIKYNDVACRYYYRLKINFNVSDKHVSRLL